MFAHSVGQVQTTKFFAPETVQLLRNRAAAGLPGFQVGDTISYIVQFTPIRNGADVGVAGYATDYIPPGTQVIGASIVRPSGSTFVDISPDLPAGIDNGTSRGANTFGAPFNTHAYDATGLCADPPGTAAAPPANQCNGSLAQQYADTGIFFSTDPRTAAFPYPPTRIQQSVNGYVVNPTGAGQLNPLLNQTIATTHNLWDAQQTNAFGTTALPTLTPNANGSQGIISSDGRAAAPFGAGSAVAGPQTGYPLDATGNVGPWQRIYYPGSRIGSMAEGPASGASTTYGDPVAQTQAIKGSPTTLGWNLSPTNPLPSNTNAVRWAIGRLLVGENKYVKISLRITAPVPAGGIINGSEVFGGDAGGADNGQDSVWRYHVPSVADNNSNLFVIKEVIAYCTDLTTEASCSPSEGATIPATTRRVRYRITYLNSGNAPQSNVVLSDTLPAQASGTSNFVVLGGTNILPTTPATPTTGTFTFKPIISLGGGEGGSVRFDVHMTVSAGTSVTNSVKLTSSAIPLGVTSNMVSSVINAPRLAVTKTTTTPTATPGGTATYTITIANTGTAPANNIIVRDFLPFSGTTADAARRFNFVPGSSTYTLNGSALAATPTITSSVPPTIAPYNVNANQQQVQWDFGGAVSLPEGQSLTITFNSTVGVNMPASTIAYTNDAITVSGGVSDTAILQAPVAVTLPLQVSKTIDCVYDAGGACNAYNGSGSIPANAKVRYRLNYANTGATQHTNVFLCDQLPTQVAGIAAVSTPTIAPTPSGPFTDSPPIGSRVSPANAACGLAGSNNFSYAIGTLAAGASGIAFFDAQTSGVTSIATITNVGKIVSTEAPGGSSSEISVSAVAPPNVSITKSTSTPAINLQGTATYTITVINNGTTPVTTIKVYDFLPFLAGATNNPQNRFNFVTGSSVFGGTIAAVTPTTVAPPTIAPYSTNTPQQQVLWDFGTQTLAPGASFTITFNAVAGNNMRASTAPYYNTSLMTYNVGTTAFTQNTGSTSPVIINPNLTLTKTIVCVYSGATCVPYVAGSTLPVNARVRYRLDYQNTGAISQTGVVLSDTLPVQTAAAPVSNVTVVSGPIPASPTTPALGSIAGGGATFSFPATTVPASTSGAITFDVQTNATNGAVVTNSAKLVSTQAPEGVTASVSTVVSAGTPNLTITKTANTAIVAPGGVVTYTLTITNTGTVAADTFQVQDFLPTSGGTTNNVATRFDFSVGSSTFGGSVTAVTPTVSVPPTIPPYNGSANQQQVTWDFGTQTLAPGASFTITFSAMAGTNMPSGTYNNLARVSFDSAAGGGSNISALVSIQVASPNLALTKTHTGTFVVGGTHTYQLTVNNTLGGLATSGTITVTDTLPNGLTYVSATGTGWSCSAAGQVVTCTSATVINAGATSANPITLTVSVAAAAQPGVTNSATVSGGGEPAANAGNNTALDYTAVVAATVSGFFTDGTQTAMPGSSVNYPHQFVAGSAGTVSFSSTNLPNPAIAGWTNIIYRDTNCNGQLDGSEGATPLTGSITVAAGEQVCIIVKAFVPASAPIGAQDQITVTANFTPATGSPQSFTRSDLTTVGAVSAQGLTLVKEVRNVSTGGTFGGANSALPGHTLEYRITYSNASTSALANIVLTDVTPPFTTFVSAACGGLAPNISACNVTTQPAAGSSGNLAWTLIGTLAPGSQSTVLFQVTVQP